MKRHCFFTVIIGFGCILISIGYGQLLRQFETPFKIQSSTLAIVDSTFALAHTETGQLYQWNGIEWQLFIPELPQKDINVHSIFAHSKKSIDVFYVSQKEYF